MDPTLRGKIFTRIRQGWTDDRFSAAGYSLEDVAELRAETSERSKPLADLLEYDPDSPTVEGLEARLDAEMCAKYGCPNATERRTRARECRRKYFQEKKQHSGVKNTLREFIPRRRRGRHFHVVENATGGLSKLVPE